MNINNLRYDLGNRKSKMNFNIENKPIWIQEAENFIGLHEIKGAKHNPTIIGWLKELGSWYFDDESAWCSTFVAAMMKHANRKIPKYWMRALAWDESVGTILDKPSYGCVVTFSRKGGGHVGFVVGEDQYGNLMVLGGNQSDAVNIKPFSKSRVKNYIWVGHIAYPYAQPLPERYDLPKYNSDGRLSTNEA